MDTNTVAMFGHLTGGHQLPYCSSTSFRLPWKGSTSTQAELHALFKCCPRQARLLSAARCQTTICCFHLASVLQTVHRLAEQGKQALLGARLGPVFYKCCSEGALLAFGNATLEPRLRKMMSLLDFLAYCCSVG